MKKYIALAAAALTLVAIAIPVSQAIEAEVLCTQIPETAQHIDNQIRRSAKATSAFKIRFNDSYIAMQESFLMSMQIRKANLQIVCPGEFHGRTH